MYYSFPAFARWAMRNQTAPEPRAQTDNIESKEAPVNTEESTDKAKDPVSPAAK